METRSKANRHIRFLKEIISVSFVEILLEGFPGGIWLFWKTNIDFTIDIVKTQNMFIQCLIKIIKKIFVG